MPPQWTDDQIITAIKGGMRMRDEALRYVLQESGWKIAVLDYIVKSGGTVEDAQDIFQETLVHFDRNIRAEQFKRESALKTYFISIAKFGWWKMYKKKRPNETFDSQIHGGSEEAMAETIILDEEKKQYWAKVMSQIGERCKKILMLRQSGYSMEEIAAEIQLSDSNAAKKEAYRCRIRLRTLLDDNPMWKDMLME